jgi:hypothetical protein
MDIEIYLHCELTIVAKGITPVKLLQLNRCLPPFTTRVKRHSNSASNWTRSKTCLIFFMIVVNLNLRPPNYDSYSTPWSPQDSPTTQSLPSEPSLDRIPQLGPSSLLPTTLRHRLNPLHVPVASFCRLPATVLLASRMGLLWTFTLPTKSGSHSQAQKRRKSFLPVD